jgi:hypothetical protein
VDGPFATPTFLLVLIYLGIVVLPATLYIYLAHTDWAWLYVVDPEDVPALAVVPLLVVHGGLLVLGWYIGARLIRSDRGNLALYGAAGSVLVLLVSVLLLAGRLGAYGSYADFQAGSTARLFKVELGWVLVAVALAFGVSTGYTALELVRDSRRVRAR